MEPRCDEHGNEQECWQCGGEGYLHECIDGCCLDAEIGCDQCTYRCDICNVKPKSS